VATWAFSRKSAHRLYEDLLGRLPWRWQVRSPIVWSRKQPIPSKPAAPETSIPNSVSARATVLVAVLGLAGRTLEDVIETVASEAGTKPITPVFITDSLDFAPFRKRRLRFEYFPDRGTRQRFVPALDWDMYECQRYVLLREKWRPRSLIWFGQPPPSECVAVINGHTVEAHPSSGAAG
jgi:hypothetical protein